MKTKTMRETPTTAITIKTQEAEKKGIMTPAPSTGKISPKGTASKTENLNPLLSKVKKHSKRQADQATPRTPTPNPEQAR